MFNSGMFSVLMILVFGVAQIGHASDGIGLGDKFKVNRDIYVSLNGKTKRIDKGTELILIGLRAMSNGYPLIMLGEVGQDGRIQKLETTLNALGSLPAPFRIQGQSSTGNLADQYSAIEAPILNDMNNIRISPTDVREGHASGVENGFTDQIR